MKAPTDFLSGDSHSIPVDQLLSTLERSNATGSLSLGTNRSGGLLRIEFVEGLLVDATGRTGTETVTEVVGEALRAEFVTFAFRSADSACRGGVALDRVLLDVAILGLA